MDLNTCLATTESYHTIAYYSHLVPVFIAVLLGVFVLFASRFSLLSRVFSIFVGTFCLWLIGDVIVWTQTDYHLVTFFWAPLDYINTVFYIAGAYFFAVLVNNGNKIPAWLKLTFLGLSVPAWWITVTGASIMGFNQPVCEAFNSEFLTNYKLAIEWAVCIYILVSGMGALRNSDRAKKIQVSVVGIALILFFAVFSVTEYISSQTGYYELNLYSLFVLPVFLALILYTITNLKMFQLRLLGTQLLVYVLLIMIGSQFFFLENTTNQILTIITFILSFFFGVTLLRNVKKEAEARRKIEKLAADLQKANTRLVELDKQKTEFISFATHQLRSPLTAIKGNTSLILEGDVGPIAEPLRNIVQTVYSSVKTMINVVEDYLNVSRIELGTMKYDMKELDFKDMVQEVANEQKPNIDAKGLALNVVIDDSQTYRVKADLDKFKQVIMNTVDNSVKYTPKGSLTLSLEKANGKIRFKAADTGVGIRPDVLPKLFQKFTRAPNASEANIHGTGLGLFIAKEIMNAHGGRIWAESAGEGKGSQFYVELPEVK
ncbi:MAG TPA: ATP-binding protein [Candidatus Paceibacterota bacterium]|nr:ATP-binding protein [Candidatus Paceibacterota bacterium]